MTVYEVLVRAKNAAAQLALLSEADKNRALNAMADRLLANQEAILAANAEDLAQAKANGMNDVMTDRLRLTAERIAGMAKGIREVVDLPHPVGQIINQVQRPNG